MRRKSGPEACDHTIQRLIGRIARRIFKEGDVSPSRSSEQLKSDIPATKASLPEYHQLERFADREEYHARLKTFINAGSVTVTWDRSAGDQGQLERVILTSPEAAANILGIQLPWTIASNAIFDLEAIKKENLPSVDHIIDGWRHGKSPGGVPANKAEQLVDSMRVIDACKSMGAVDKDLLLRRLSVQLFGNSKRIEALSRPLSFLNDGPDCSPDDNKNDIFARLGLVKYPQPMLLSGPDSCSVQVEGKLVPFIHPYIGLRPDVIKGLEIGNKKVMRILTIENLASFNEAAQDDSNPDDLILIYVAGNPTPSLLKAYKKLLKTVRPSALLHWGDIDVGGFRIASRLAETAYSTGFRLNLFNMNAMESAKDQTIKVNERYVSQIMEICEKQGWDRESEGLQKHPVFQEQEFICWQPNFINQN